MGSKTVLVVCCLFAVQTYAQYQQNEEPGRLQPRPQSRIRFAPQGGASAGPSGEFIRQGIPTGPRSRRPIPAGAFPVPAQGLNNRARLQLPPQSAPQPAPITPSFPSTLKPAPVREEPQVQNAIPQPTYPATPVEEIIDDDDELVTPRSYSSSPVTSSQFAPVQIPRTTPHPEPLPYRPQQATRPSSRPPPAFRPEPRNPNLQQEAPIRQSRPQPRPQNVQEDRGDRGDRERAPVSQSVRRYREDRPDGSIVWGFENDDGSFKEEVIGADCIVRGKYGYVDPEGVRREYEYTSGNPCERDEQGRLIPDDDAGEGGQYVLPQAANELNINAKHKSRRPN